MKITNDGDFGGCANRVILVSENWKNFDLTAQEESLIDRFAQSDKDWVLSTDLEKTIILAKTSDNAEKMRLLGAKTRENVSSDVGQIAIIGDSDACFPFCEGLLLANYQFLKYLKDREKRTNALNELVAPSLSDSQTKELLDITNAVSWARTMVNEPVSFLNAEQFASEMKSLENSSSLSVNVLEETQIESLKMGGLLAVNKGSVDPPTFTILEHKPENPINEKPIVLVGKGVVYDTGGLSLKPTPNSMDLMKSDMGGAATVVGATYLAALQNLPVHVITLVPASDNRPGLNAYAPGDVITMFNGLTVEVMNTDAEGRMLLADALAYSNKYDPELVLDVATLTGAAVRAVGDFASVVMGNAEQKYFDQLESSGNKCHERLVQFPFWDDYAEEMKSAIADLNNLGGPNAGMITAGKFLEHFVDAPFVHIDLAGPSWVSKTTGYRTKGGSGVGVRLLYEFLKNYNNG